MTPTQLHFRLVDLLALPNETEGDEFKNDSTDSFVLQEYRVRLAKQKSMEVRQ